MTQITLHEHAFSVLAERLTPSKPVRDPASLRGREKDFRDCVHQLVYGGSAPFIYGDRGIGKTSLALSSAQQVCKSDREPIYVACAPGMTFVELMQEVLISLSDLVVELGLVSKKRLTKLKRRLV